MRPTQTTQGEDPQRQKLWAHLKQKKASADCCRTDCCCGGKRGIRTPVPVLPATRFPGVPLKPLEHLSLNAVQKYCFFCEKRQTTVLFYKTLTTWRVMSERGINNHTRYHYQRRLSRVHYNINSSYANSEHGTHFMIVSKRQKGASMTINANIFDRFSSDVSTPF